MIFNRFYLLYVLHPCDLTERARHRDGIDSKQKSLREKKIFDFYRFYITALPSIATSIFRQLSHSIYSYEMTVCSLQRLEPTESN